MPFRTSAFILPCIIVFFSIDFLLLARAPAPVGVSFLEVDGLKNRLEIISDVLTHILAAFCNLNVGQNSLMQL